MKDILQVKFRGECKAPVYTTRRGKHLFCGEPTPDGSSYCNSCGSRMTVPTRHFVDTAEKADTFGGGKTRPMNDGRTVPGGAIMPTDAYMRGVERGLGNTRDEVRSAAFIKSIRIVA